jgi:hypothetical protein
MPGAPVVVHQDPAPTRSPKCANIVDFSIAKVRYSLVRRVGSIGTTRHFRRPVFSSAEKFAIAMKIPFRGWGSGGSRCGEASSIGGSGGPTMRNKKDGRAVVGGRSAKARTKDSLDTTKESSASLYEEPSSSPVDMDQFCAEDASNISDTAAVAHVTEAEDERLVIDAAFPASDFDGAQAGEEKATFDAIVVMPPDNTSNDRRTSSALTKAMTIKQANLTNAMEGLFDDAFAMVDQRQEDQGRDTPPDDDDKESIPIAELKERVAEHMKKQGRVTKQFIDLIRHLEDEAMMKEAINHELQKRLKLANQLLEEEGLDAVEANVFVPSTISTANGHRSSRKERHCQSTAMPQRTPPTIDTLFAITEIHCDHNVEKELDDVSCLVSEMAAEDQPPPQQPEKKKLPPGSPVTERTAVSDESIQVALHLHSEKELLEF